ncbi:MAG: MFS transporter [Actinobacteria bacterium]|nr:MFS transporter [Actinomycetota bacterium]MBU1943779.1 MFS transporter [Actinomycetota bacterium]MBU2688244.1 MFS transporter [Actinomycetota bacterium]
MIYPLLPIFLSSVLGAGAVAIGLVEGVAEGTASVLKGFSGYISDRVGRRKALILAGYGISTFAKPLFAAADAVWQVLVVRFVDRVGKGLRTAPRDAMIAETTDPSIRGKAYSFHRAMDTLGAVVGPAIAFLLMWLLRGTGDSAYRWVFLAAFVPGLVSVLIIVFAIREKRAGARADRPHLTLRGLGRDYRALMLVVALFMLGNSSDAFLLLRARSLGMQAYLIPLLWMAFNLVYSVAAVPCGMLSDRIGRKKPLLIGFILYGFIYVGFGFAHRLVYVWLLMGAYGVFYGLTHGVMSAYVADLAPPGMKGTAFGVYHTTDGISRLLASVIFGLIWQSSGTYGPSAAFFFGAGMAVLAGILLWTLCAECAPGVSPPAPTSEAIEPPDD